MSFPVMKRNKRQTMSLPALEGGINMRDSVGMVSASQLTDGMNVWFRDGVLKTRPGIECYTVAEDNAEDSIISVSSHEIFSGEKQLCTVSAYTVTTDGSHTRIYFYWCGAVSTEALPFIRLDSLASGEAPHYFVFRREDVLYCFAERTIYSLESGGVQWNEVGEDERYVPLVATHCQPHFGSCVSKDVALSTGERYEGFNLIGTRYRMIYDNCNYGMVENVVGGLAMYYWLPFSCLDFKNGEKIIVNYTDDDGKIYTHSITCNGSVQVDEQDPPDDGKYLHIMGRTLSFRSKETSSAYKWSSTEYAPDSVEIIAPCPVSEEALDKVFNMSNATWFGGASAGINGGTRLFLCGNTGPQYGGLMMWSGLNEPLYFPENGFVNVGDPTQPITAFAKQSDMLVIFKENETYYTKYTQDNSVFAYEVKNNEASGWLSPTVYFPLTMISQRIGCDCPNTIQLCRNRLVWTGSNGKVYSLITEDRFNERNIYEIGELMERRLSRETGIKNAISCDWEGYYVLMCDNRIYLMDYNSNGFQYSYSYRKNEDANKEIPWYYWELPSDTTGQEHRRVLLLLRDNMCLFGSFDGRLLLYGIKPELYDDCGAPIHCEMQTGLFDLKPMGCKKNVETVTLSLGDNGGAPIGVVFVTDNGVEYDEIVLENGEIDTYSPEYINTVGLSPAIRSVTRFGIRLSCEGVLAVERISFAYKPLSDEIK